MSNPYPRVVSKADKRIPCPNCGRPLRRGPRAASGKIRWTCERSAGGSRTYCFSSTNPEKGVVRDQVGRAKKGGRVKAPVFKRDLREVKRFIITAAQNATPLHEPFFASLLTYCKATGAELIVIPLRYKNPTSAWTASQQNAEKWDPALKPFLYNQRRTLNKNLVLLGDIKTQPTASSPLTGYEAITHGESGILGHTKLQLLSIPTPQAKLAKLLTTTGAVTRPNYTDSRAGKLGEFHHTLGAMVAEIEGPIFHMRHVNGSKEDGSFIDLDKWYYPDKVTDAPPALALIMGDTHVDFISPRVKEATFGEGGIVDIVKPQHLVWHDLFDGYTVNPHHKGNIFNAIGKMRGGRVSARNEVLRACRFVKDHTPKGTVPVIVASNHDDFLRRWIVNANWKEDAENAEFYLETALAMVRATELKEGGTSYPSAFAYWAKKYLEPHGAKVLSLNESFNLGGVELGMHGEIGPNGSIGSVRNLRRIGVKSVIGHSHSPAIDEGCYQVGTSTHLKLEYNNGPSSWLNTHCILYANGKRTLVNIINGSWRL